MKTLIPAALGASCLGLHLTSNEVHGFLVPAVPARRATSSRRSSQGLSRREVHAAARAVAAASPSCRSATACRMSSGFGEAQKSSGKKTPTKGKKADKVRGEGGDKGETKGTGKRQLFMQFTCNKCDGVSRYMINKDAYEEGIVICTCQNCQVRHLLADNLKKMDVPEFGNNIEEYMQSKGSPDEIRKGRAPGLTSEMLDKYDVNVGADGVLNLAPKGEATEGETTS